MKAILARAGLLLGLCLPAFGGCTTDTGSSEDSNLESGNAEYDRVIAAGAPKVTLDTTRSATQSASGRLVGWLPSAKANNVIARFTKLGQWNEIKNAAGEQMFKSGKVSRNTIVNGAGELVGELESDVTLKIAGPSAVQGGRYVLHLENTETAKKLFVSVVSKGNLQIDVKFVSYTREGVEGVIVDASLKVKLNVSEDQADALANGLTPIFNWVKAGQL